MLATVYPSSAEVLLATLLKVPFDTCVVHLAQAALPLGPTLDAAACTAVEATFTGYSAITTAVANAVFPDPVNQGVTYPVEPALFTVGATPTVTNDIYGFFLFNTAGALLLAGNFTTPYPMTGAGDAMFLAIFANFFGTEIVYGTINGNPA